MVSYLLTTEKRINYHAKLELIDSSAKWSLCAMIHVVVGDILPPGRSFATPPTVVVVGSHKLIFRRSQDGQQLVVAAQVQPTA